MHSSPHLLWGDKKKEVIAEKKIIYAKKYDKINSNKETAMQMRPGSEPKVSGYLYKKDGFC